MRTLQQSRRTAKNEVLCLMGQRTQAWLSCSESLGQKHVAAGTFVTLRAAPAAKALDDEDSRAKNMFL